MILNVSIDFGQLRFHLIVNLIFIILGKTVLLKIGNIINSIDEFIIMVIIYTPNLLIDIE